MDEDISRRETNKQGDVLEDFVERKRRLCVCVCGGGGEGNTTFKTRRGGIKQSMFVLGI